MTWYAWTLVAAIVLSSALAVARVGQPRKPLTGGDAVTILVVNGLIVWAIFALAERCS